MQMNTPAGQNQVIIEFSSLTDEEKDSYISHLMRNNPATGEEILSSDAITSTLKINPALLSNNNINNIINGNNHQASYPQKKPKSSISAFTLAKTKRSEFEDRRNIPHSEAISALSDQFKQAFDTNAKSINKPIITSSIVPLNQVIEGSIERYPLLYSFQKTVDKWIRPKRLPKEELQKMIEEIYSSKFAKDSSRLAAIQKGSSAFQSFPLFVFEYLKKRAKQPKQLQQSLVNLLLSCDFYSQKDPEVSLFADFLGQRLDDDSVIFFLFARAVCEQEADVEFFSKAKQFQDPSLVKITFQKAKAIASIIYGEGDQTSLQHAISSIYDACEFDSNNSTNIAKKTKKISISKLLNLLVSLYSNPQISSNPSSQFPGDTSSQNTQSNIRNFSASSKFPESPITPQYQQQRQTNPETKSTMTQQEKEILKNLELLDKRLLTQHQNPNQQTNQSSYRNPPHSTQNPQPNKQQTHNSNQNQNQQHETLDAQTVYENPFSNESSFVYKSDFQLQKELEQQQQLEQQQHNELRFKNTNYHHEQHNLVYGDHTQYEDEESEHNTQHESQQSQYRIELNNESQQLIFLNVHERLEEFIQLMLAESANAVQAEQANASNTNETEQAENIEAQQALKDELYTRISRRVNDLLAALFNENPSIWFLSSHIAVPTIFQVDYFRDLQTKYTTALQQSPELLTPHTLNRLSKKILQTPELAKEIGRIITELTRV